MFKPELKQCIDIAQCLDYKRACNALLSKCIGNVPDQPGHVNHCTFHAVCIYTLYMLIYAVFDHAVFGNSYPQDPDFGYVTFCPTNLGTTLRASVHINFTNLTPQQVSFPSLFKKRNRFFKSILFKKFYILYLIYLAQIGRIGTDPIKMERAYPNPIIEKCWI